MGVLREGGAEEYVCWGLGRRMLHYVCARFLEQWLAKVVSREAEYVPAGSAACRSTALLVTRASIQRVSSEAVLT